MIMFVILMTYVSLIFYFKLEDLQSSILILTDYVKEMEYRIQELESEEK
jgi:hypothetical protein